MILLAHVETVSRFVEIQMLNISICSNPITVMDMGWISWIKANCDFIMGNTSGCTTKYTETGNCV
jgi:hypothetical protein